MTNKEILAIAMAQSAIDINCAPEDFQKKEHVIVRSQVGGKARAYYQEPIACNLVSYGNNIVASVKDEYRDIVEEYINSFSWYHCFETPNLHWLNDRMRELGQKVCFMAEYFLPDMDRMPATDWNTDLDKLLEAGRRAAADGHAIADGRAAADGHAIANGHTTADGHAIANGHTTVDGHAARACGYELRLLEQRDFAGLYLPEWSNALCELRRSLDVLGVGAYENGRLIGLAGCSADCDSMWQIGVDVLPQYRRRGIASTLTGTLAAEILKRGRVPFYCCAWSNIPSARNAVRSGFVPAWAEMTVKPAKLVDMMNRGGI